MAYYMPQELTQFFRSQEMQRAAPQQSIGRITEEAYNAGVDPNSDTIRDRYPVKPVNEPPAPQPSVPMPPPYQEPQIADDSAYGVYQSGKGRGQQDNPNQAPRPYNPYAGTGGPRPMAPPNNAYFGGQGDVFGRPSYMYSQQQRSPYMPMQPYSMGSPYQERMGKGGQGYNQRNPYANPYGPQSQGFDIKQPQTPYYQPPQRSPMKGGGYNPQPYSQTPMKGGQQPQMSQGSDGGNTPLPADFDAASQGVVPPTYQPPLTGGNTPLPQGGDEVGMNQNEALQSKLAEIERMGGQSAYDQSRLNMARYNAYKGTDGYNAYTDAKGELLGDTANMRDNDSNQYVFTGNEYETLGDPSTWDRATAINRDFYQGKGLIPMLTTKEYERLSNNLGRNPTKEELDFTRTQLAQDKNYMYNLRTGDSNQAYLDYINSRGQDVQVDDPFYQYNAQSANPYVDNKSDGRTAADYQGDYFDGTADGVWNPPVGGNTPQPAPVLTGGPTPPPLGFDPTVAPNIDQTQNYMSNDNVRYNPYQGTGYNPNSGNGRSSY